MSAIFENLRKSIQMRIFKNKDAEYHPRDEEDLEARKRAQKIREKEKSRSEAAKIRAAIARDALNRKNKHSKKHGSYEHGLYEKKTNPSYCSLDHVGPPSVFHRSSPVCRKLRVSPKNVM